MITVEINMYSGRITRTIRMREAVVFNQHLRSAPCPESASSSPFATIVVASRMIHRIMVHMNIFHFTHLYAGASGIGNIIFMYIYPVNIFVGPCDFYASMVHIPDATIADLNLRNLGCGVIR